MKDQHFFYVGLGLLLLALLGACGQVPITKPETGQPAPVEVVAPQAEASGQHSIEAIPAIDPADRKFFNPGYGAQPVMSGEAEVLPTLVKDEVDPDQDIGLLEFFSPVDEASSGGPKEAETLPTIETDMNGDLGLMEFFSRSNEAGAPQAIETDADQDIGLMEFRPQALVGLR